MGIFWLWRQISQIGLLVAPNYSRHVLFSILLRVGWIVKVVFTIKIGREMAIFQAGMKTSNWCLCQFRLFFFFLTFTGGNPGRIQSRQIHLAGNPVSFFCLQIEKVLCLLTSFSYTFTEFFFFFGSSFHESFKFFGHNGLQTYKGNTSSMLLLRSCVFFTFCCLSWNVSCSIHLKFSKRSKF